MYFIHVLFLWYCIQNYFAGCSKQIFLSISTLIIFVYLLASRGLYSILYFACWFFVHARCNVTKFKDIIIKFHHYCMHMSWRIFFHCKKCAVERISFLLCTSRLINSCYWCSANIKPLSTSCFIERLLSYNSAIIINGRKTQKWLSLLKKWGWVHGTIFTSHIARDKRLGRE